MPLQITQRVGFIWLGILTSDQCLLNIIFAAVVCLLLLFIVIIFIFVIVIIVTIIELTQQ